VTIAGPTTDIPLFPLNTVLFPGGLLSLRVFERRYLDLVRDCARTGGGFGVCLILHGRESGEPAVPAAIGTLANIVDFYTETGGLLGICVRGSRRFHVERSRVRDNGLAHGEVAYSELVFRRDVGLKLVGFSARMHLFTGPQIDERDQHIVAAIEFQYAVLNQGLRHAFYLHLQIFSTLAKRSTT